MIRVLPPAPQSIKKKSLIAGWFIGWSWLADGPIAAINKYKIVDCRRRQMLPLSPRCDAAINKYKIVDCRQRQWPKAHNALSGPQSANTKSLIAGGAFRAVGGRDGDAAINKYKIIDCRKSHTGLPPLAAMPQSTNTKSLIAGAAGVKPCIPALLAAFRERLGR